MAIITTSSRFQFGSFLPRQAQHFNTVGINMTTANGGIAFPFIAEKTMTVTDIGVQRNSIGTTFATALTIGIQTDSGSGVPSGTFLTNGSVTLPSGTWSTAMQFTCSSGNPLITTTQAHYQKVGDTVRFINTTGGFAINTNYWIVSVPTATQMTLSTSSTLTPVFTPSATVTAGANTIPGQPGFTHCDGITASITQGNRYWLVFQWSGTSTGQTFFYSGDTGTGSGQSVMYGLGYATRNASVWAKVATTRGNPVVYTNGTAWYGQPQLQNGLVNSTTLNNNDRAGFRFTVPANHPDILLDRVSFPFHPTSSPGTGFNWKAQLFLDNGASPATFVTDLSVIAGDTLGNASGAGNFSTTIFQTPSTTWLTAGTSYILLSGFDVSPSSGFPTVNYFTGFVSTPSRAQVIGAYKGDYIVNWQGANTWFAANPESHIPWAITAGGLRYNDSGGGGGGGYRNASSGFANLGGN